ncbi:MAG: hypothetical protein ACREFX_08365 [Opitutaceae bacterium]
MDPTAHITRPPLRQALPAYDDRRARATHDFLVLNQHPHLVLPPPPDPMGLSFAGPETPGGRRGP